MIIGIFIFFLGLIFGSFISALSWRLPRGEDFTTDRSKCDKCKKPISWYDNIPLFSYIFLGGKCRNCGKKISMRYPLIELSTAAIFLGILGRFGSLGILPTMFYLLLATLLITIFVIDFELQIIPDELVFILISTVAIRSILSSDEHLFIELLSGFAASLFLMIINFITKGKGMGLGDVKLALVGGLILGYPKFITWLFLSFILGATIGVTLIFFGKTEFGKRIAFGPFLVSSLFIVLFWGDKISSVFLPYL